MNDDPTVRHPIPDSQVDAEIAAVVDGHAKPAASPVVLHLDRKAVIALCVAAVAIVVLALVGFYATLTAGHGKDATIADLRDQHEVDTARGQQIEKQLAAAQVQGVDADAQAKCRAQAANDYEAVASNYLALTSTDVRLFLQALRAATSHDTDATATYLDQAASIDAQLVALDPKLAAVTDARAESVTTCAQAAAHPTGG